MDESLSMPDSFAMEKGASSDSGGPVDVEADDGEFVTSPAMPPYKSANVNPPAVVAAALPAVVAAVSHY